MTKKLALLCVSDEIFSRGNAWSFDPSTLLAETTKEIFQETGPSYVLWGPSDSQESDLLKKGAAIVSDELGILANPSLRFMRASFSAEEAVGKMDAKRDISIQVMPFSSNFTAVEKLAEIGRSTLSVLVVATEATIKDTLNLLIAMDDPQSPNRNGVQPIKNGVAVILEPKYPRFTWPDLREGSRNNTKSPHFSVAKYIP